MKNLVLYTINPDYCRFLRQYDRKVSISFDNKNKRPFIGIVLSINDFKYFAPLTSPKPKHRKMHNMSDFIKVKDGELGAINLNNMIPVPDFCLMKADLKIVEEDTQDIIQYKTLLNDQLVWCNKNKEFILERALKLYCELIAHNLPVSILNRCCNFPFDEKQSLEFLKKHKQA